MCRGLIASPTLSMLIYTKVAGYYYFNQFLCNILLSKTKTKTKMGVTSYPKELAPYKWHQKVISFDKKYNKFEKQQTATLETLSLGSKCRRPGKPKKYN
jgi:hypothetical protein